MLRDLRRDYTRLELHEDELTANPIDLLKTWQKDAIEAKELEPTAITVSTCIDGEPDSRIVLLKEIDEGLVFYTNYLSQKGVQIALNNKVAISIFWPILERQVRIKGIAEKVSEAHSESYFKSRPVDSQLGAWTSEQSQEIQSRDELDERFQKYASQFKDSGVPKPHHWGGYRVTPHEIEFWQGRSNRLHDRFRYYKNENSWKIKRLAP